MAKTAAERIAKYKAKFDPDVARARFAAVKDLAGEPQEARQTELSSVRDTVRAILDSKGVPSIGTILYLSYANKLYKINKEFTGGVKTKEVNAAYYLWKTRLTQLGIPDSACLPVLAEITPAITGISAPE